MIQLLAKVKTDLGEHEELFLTPNLLNAAQGLGALVLSTIATQNNAAEPHPKHVRIKLYKAQTEDNKILEHTVVKLADLELDFEEDLRFTDVVREPEEPLVSLA